MIVVLMDPAAEHQASNDQLRFLKSNFSARIPSSDDHGREDHQLRRMDESKMTLGWGSKAPADTVRPSEIPSYFVEETQLPTVYAAFTDSGVGDGESPFSTSNEESRSQYSSLASRSNSSSRSSGMDVAFEAPSSASAPSSSGASSEKDNVVLSSSDNGDDGTVRVPSGSGYRIMTPFPWRLHEILEEVEKKKLDHIVSWLPDGLAFQVHCQDSFSDVIIPMFFRHSRYKSFQRQLYLYGFRSMETHALTRGRWTRNALST
jgi:HSF-type DNA-binding